MSARAYTVGLLAIAWMSAGPACLSAGDPPAGRQIYAGRDHVLLDVLPPRDPDDGITRVLALVPRYDPSGFSLSDLYVLSGATSPRLLVEGWACGGPFECFALDSRGRLFTRIVNLPIDPLTPGWQKLIRVDPDTSERLDLGITGVVMSASRTRVAVQALPGAPSTDEIKVIEPDDAVSTLTAARDGMFVGEDLFFMDGDAEALMRLPPGGQPVVVQARVQHYTVVPATDGPKFLVWHLSDDPLAVGPMSLLDPVTGRSQLLPRDALRMPSFSSDARWALIHEDTGRRRFRLVDLSSGAEEPFEVPIDVTEPVWRPGRAEVWCLSQAYPDRSGFIKKFGQDLTQLPADVVPFAATREGLFTRDGNRWFSGIASPTGADAGVYIGDADNPGGPRFLLNPDGTFYGQHHELSDGRLVYEGFYRGGDRNDMYVIDPKNGDRRLLGTAGGILATGETRVLAATHRNAGASDLSVIDVNGGAPVPLALEFAWDAHAQGEGGAPSSLAPGALVAFQFRARFASPYDGIWLATLP